MKRKLIYLTVPYSDPDPFVRLMRFILVSRLAAKIFKDGHFVFSPISHTHPIKELSSMEGNWSFWADYDSHMLSLCDELHVLILEGWDKSHGVTNEIDLAKKLGKPVVYLLKSHGN